MAIDYDDNIYTKLVLNEYDHIPFKNIQVNDYIRYLRYTAEGKWKIGKGGYVIRIGQQMTFKVDIFMPWSYMWRLNHHVDTIKYFKRVEAAKRLHSVEKELRQIKKRLRILERTKK